MGADSDVLSSRFGQVLDATDTVVWEVDLEEGSVDSVGPIEEVTGLPRSELDDPMVHNTRIVHPEDRTEVTSTFEQLLDGREEPVDVEYRTNPDNGRVRWIRTQASVESGQDGRPTTMVGLSTDITPLKQREARLEEFAGVVSHDLRNPLSVAKGRLALARDEHDSENLEQVADALDRMEGLIENLLTLARANQRVGDLDVVTLETVVREAWAAVDTADATLSVEVDRGLRADGARLRQLFENLFCNAIEHGGRDVTVRVGPTEDGFYVADDGVGIPPDRRKVLFVSGEERTGDRGLGLRIVERVAEAHGWRPAARESDGGGARFEFAGVEFV